MTEDGFKHRRLVRGKFHDEQGVSPFSKVFLNSQAISSATTIPSRYMASMVSPWSLKKPKIATSGIAAPIKRV